MASLICWAMFADRADEEAWAPDVDDTEFTAP